MPKDEGKEIAALKHDIERLRTAKRKALAIADRHAIENVDLRAENERLRAALCRRDNDER
jgi:hypothetical protein